MIATDAEFNIVTCNAVAGELLGLQAGEMIGKSIFQTVPENRRSLLERLLHRTMERRRTSEFEIRQPTGSGGLRHLLVILSPVPDES